MLGHREPGNSEEKLSAIHGSARRLSRPPVRDSPKRAALVRKRGEDRGERCAVVHVAPPPISLDYRGWPRRRPHSPRAERMKVKPPSPPSAQSVQTKKKPLGDLAISP